MIEEAEKTSVIRRIGGWVGYLVLIGALLYAFAPSSWWQFGVTTVENRKEIASFTLKGLDNSPDWKFAEKRGKVLLVNYWATWCGPCRYETPGLVNISKEFSDTELEVVGVTVDQDLSLVPPFVERYKITYPIVRVRTDPNVGGSMKLPTTFLYDKQGRLAKKYTGMVLESTLRSDIKSLLKES